MAGGIERRWVALDRLRALAVLLMIQGHAFYALLRESEQAEPWYRTHQVIHGLTAPMFLTGAGLAFGITTYANWDKFRRDDDAQHARLRRYLLIIGLGYLLQLPGMSLGQTWNASPEVWARVVQVGPLQLIGVGLFLAQVATRLLPRPVHHAGLAGLLALAITAIAPFTWNLEPTDVSSAGLMAWLNGTQGSQFPAFPWVAYLLGGMAVSSACLAPRAERVLRSGVTWGVVGALFCGVTYALYRLDVNPYGEHDFWRSSPLYTVFRGGGVALGLALCSIGASRQHRLDHGLAALARHSLLAYVAHLVLLYGAYPLPGMVHLLGRRELSLGAASFAAGVLLLATFAILTAWHRAQRTPRVADWTRLSLAAACMMMLLR